MCGTWLDHWEKFSRQSADMCAVDGCAGTDLVGAHVLLAGADLTSYIVPLCKSHNRTAGLLEIPNAFPLIHANKAVTCEKPKAPPQQPRR